MQIDIEKSRCLLRLGRTEDEVHKIINVLMACRESIPLDEPVKHANGDIIIDLILEKEKYYRGLLKHDYGNRDYAACIVCQAKLHILDELEFDISSRLSV